MIHENITFDMIFNLRYLATCFDNFCPSFLSTFLAPISASADTKFSNREIFVIYV